MVTEQVQLRGYGWVPELPDWRDKIYSPPPGIDATALTDLRPQMPPIYDQGQLGCHDEKTEVLTERGWQRWTDYDGSLLGTVSPLTHTLEFQAPTALQAYEYDGPMYYVDRRSLDFALTPNHRMYARRWNERARTLSPDYEFREVQDIGWYAGLLAAPSGFAGTHLQRLKIGRREYNGDDLLALLALIASDGWVGGADSNWNTVSFCCFRDDRLPMVRELAGKLGLHETPDRAGVWKWSDEALANWLRANLYTGPIYRSPYKRVPDLVRVASQQQIEKFLQFFGDQHIDSKGARQFYSSSRRMVDDLQELLLRIGKRSGIYEREPRSTTMADGRRIEADHCVADITITEWRTNSLSIEKKRTIGTDHYQGPVFCATVPNSTLITRRNGSVLISGNSCTANGICTLIRFSTKKNGGRDKDFPPSRLFVYYNERDMEGTVSVDAGAFARDGIKSIASIGVTSEWQWPYDISRFAVKPPPKTYRVALWHEAISYARVPQNEAAMKACLAEGFPIGIGASLYDSFESAEVAQTGIVPMPSPNEGMVGGHYFCIVGVTDTHWICQNSWGPDWGDHGYFYMPLAYLTDSNLSDDLWTIRLFS